MNSESKIDNEKSKRMAYNFLKDAKKDIDNTDLFYISLEKALAINPNNTKAKFNLSLLLSSIPSEASKIISEQSVQELSNIPIGLP